MMNYNLHTCASCGYTQSEYYFKEVDQSNSCPSCSSKLVTALEELLTAIDSRDLPSWFNEALIVSAKEYPSSDHELEQLVGINLSNLLVRDSRNIILDIDIMISKGFISPVPEGKAIGGILDLPPTVRLDIKYDGFEFEISPFTYTFLNQACFEHYKTKEHLGHSSFPLFLFPQRVDEQWLSIQVMGTNYVILVECHGTLLNMNARKVSWGILASISNGYDCMIDEIHSDEFQSLDWVINKFYPIIAERVQKDNAFKRRFGTIRNMKFLADKVQSTIGQKIGLYNLHKELKLKQFSGV